MNKNVIWGVIVAVSIAGMIACGYGCGSDSKPGGKNSQDTVPSAVSADKAVSYSSTIKPNELLSLKRAPLNASATHLSELIFDGLVNKQGVDDKGRQKFSWALASQWKEAGLTAEKRRVVRVELAFAKWHDGHDFTADDVIFTFQALKDSDAPAKGWITSFIDKIDKIDARTIEIHLHVERSEEVVQELLSSFKIIPQTCKLANGQTIKLPTNLNQEGSAKDFAIMPVGTGPFAVQDYRTVSAKFLANEVYFLGVPEIKAFNFQKRDDYNLLIKSMLDNQTDIIMDVHPDSIDKLEAKGFIKTVTYPYAFHTIVYNTRRKPFNSVKLRQAANLATDKITLASKMFPVDDVTDFINTSIFPHNYQYVMDCDDNGFASSTPLNPRQAKEMVNAIGRQSFSLLITSEKQGKEILNAATAYKEMMAAAGLTVEINDQSLAQYNAMLEQRNYDAVYVVYEGFDHFYDIRSLFAPKGKLNLFSDLDDTNLDSLLDRFGKSISYETLVTVTKAIHKDIEEAVPACFLYTLPRYTFYNRKIGSVSIHPNAGFVNVNKWKL